MRSGRILFAFGAVCAQVAVASCGLLGPDEPPKPNACDPTSSLYIKDQHYISRDYVTEDGTVDYARWFESRKAQSSPCDPITKGAPAGQGEPVAPVPASEKTKKPPVLLEEEKSEKTESPGKTLPETAPKKAPGS